MYMYMEYSWYQVVYDIYIYMYMYTNMFEQYIKTLTFSCAFTYMYHIQHYKQKPGNSSSSTTSSSSSTSTSHHHHHHAPSSLSSQSLSNQPDQSKPSVKHKPPHPTKDPGQSSSNLGRSHSSHAHTQLPHGGKQPPSTGKGQIMQQVPPGHKPHHSHNHPPHPHQSKSGSVAAVSVSQSQHLAHTKLASLASVSSTKPHHVHHTDGKHHVTSGMSTGASNKYLHQSQSGIHGAKSATELSNALVGGSGHLPHMKHQRPPQGGGMHMNPSSDVSSKHRHHKLHTRVSDPHLNHSYEQQRGIKRPHSEENIDRKRLKLDPSGMSSFGLPSLPPLPPLPADPPPPPPPSSVSGTGLVVSTNATLPPLPLMGSGPLRQPPLPPPLPLSNPDESPPPPPPPPNH